jgi:hypothetical protein
MINNIRMEWEMHRGGKLQVKDLKSHESKSIFSLYYVYMDTPFHIIKKTLNDILHEVAKMLFLQRMLPNDEPFQPTLPQISNCGQVSHLKGVNILGYDKIPCHVREK